MWQIWSCIYTHFQRTNTVSGSLLQHNFSSKNGLNTLWADPWRSWLPGTNNAYTEKWNLCFRQLTCKVTSDINEKSLLRKQRNSFQRSVSPWFKNSFGSAALKLILWSRKVSLSFKEDQNILLERFKHFLFTEHWNWVRMEWHYFSENVTNHLVLCNLKSVTSCNIVY